MRQSGWPHTFPSRSWSAPSTAHFAAISPGISPTRPRLDLAEEAHRACDRLVVVGVRRALSVADEIAVADGHLDDLGARVRAAGDDERLVVFELEDAALELHAGQPIRPTGSAMM